MKVNRSESNDNLDIAIVGMACRYPGNVNSPKEFLQFLLNGGNGIVEIPGDRWDINSYYDPDKSKTNKMYVKRGGFLGDIDKFDPLFFGISPKEAPHIDPQHRWLLEITLEALENAGITPSSIKGSDTAVYIGQFMHDYEQLLLDSNAHKNMTSHTATGPSMTLTANRISYVFDFIGPSVTLDTACSSSLVALDLACKAILNGDSRMAVAGGVNILLRPELTMSICAASMLSPDGYCKSFDASANGYVRSEGAGVVVVKSLRDALENGDPVLAVIKASAVNQDGQTLGITVPNGESQKKLLAKTFSKAGLFPKDIQYAEAHGTGTAVGDPIEINALGSLLKERDGEPCVIGSVKSNVGHMEAAAGMAGVMKTVLAMNEGTIPRNLHFKEINPAIDLQQLKLDVANEAKPWPDTHGSPRRALVNSFGFGGTNANVILEQAPNSSLTVIDQKPVINSEKKLLTISAKSEQALMDLAGSYLFFFKELAESTQSDANTLLHDICYTAALRRDHYKHRLGIAAGSVGEFIESLQAWLEKKVLPNVWSGIERAQAGGNICFVFSGMGTQWAGVGKELYENEPVFKEEMERCDKAFSQYAGWSLVDAIFNSDDVEAIHSTNIAQPVIFATQVSLAKLLQSWGVSAQYIVGHSAGEVAASYVAGALSFEDAVKVIYHRSRLQHTTEGSGKMLAVGLSEGELSSYLAGLENKVSVGAINSDDAITLSGDAEALELIASKLDDNGVFARFLKVGVPYHSPVMDQLKSELIDSLRDICPQKPGVRLFSTVSANETQKGDWSAEYWFKNVREPVNFKGAINNIARQGVSAFIEIGPHAALLSSIKSTLASRKSQPATIPTLRRNQDAIVNIYETLAMLHINNIASPWEILYPKKGRVVSLPNYAWQKSSYWCESDEVRQARIKNTGLLGAFEQAEYPLLGGKLGSDHWLWQFQLDLNDVAYLQDHKVSNDIVYPGAGYVEIGLSIAASYTQSSKQNKASGFVLENLKFHKALYLKAEAPRVIESSFDATTGQFFVSSTEKSSSEWEMFASGVVAYKKNPHCDEKIDLDLKRTSLTRHISGKEFYEHCNKLGLEYEDTFTPIESVQVNDGVALSKIRVSDEVLKAQQDYNLHPIILDAAFQTFFATVDIGYLPASIQAIEFYCKPSGQCYCYYETIESSPERVLGNLALCDEQGNILVNVFGIEVLAIQRKESSRSNIKTLTYGFEWEADNGEQVEIAGEGLWVLLTDKGDVGESVKAQLEEKNQQVCLVEYGSAFRKNAERDFTVRPDSSEDLETVFQEVAGISKGVIYFRDAEASVLEDTSSDILGNICEKNAYSLVCLTQALSKTEFRYSQKLFLVSCGAQAVVSESSDSSSGISDSSEALAAAGHWGFGRVLGNEHPELHVTLLDLPGSEKEKEQHFSLLVSEVLSESNDQEVAYRNGARYINRLEYLNDFRLQKFTHNEYQFANNEPFTTSEGGKNANALKFQPLDLPEPTDYDVLFGSEYSSIIPDGNVKSIFNIVVGRVEKSGSAVTSLRTNERAILFSNELPRSHYCVNEHKLATFPKSIDAEKMAVFAAPFLLAKYIFEKRIRVSSGNTILVHHACAPLGVAILGLAKKEGINAFVTVRSTEEKLTLEKLGYNSVYSSINYSDVRELKKNMPLGGFDVVFSDWEGSYPTDVEFYVSQFGHLVKVLSSQSNSDMQNISTSEKSFSLHTISVAGFLSEIIFNNTNDLMLLADDIDMDLLSEVNTSHINIEEYARNSSRESEDRVEYFNVIDYSTPPATGIEGIVKNYIKPNLSYLVTGGLGGLGLEIMKWLADKGAKSIVLVGRSAPGREAIERIESVRAEGVTVEVMQGDVACIGDVETIISKIQLSLSPLGGIVHSAGVLDDGVIVKQNADKIRKVFSPKIKGAWNLHLATRHLPLDLFVCFSSIASIVGWAGQSNYAYANAFMDALAYYRRSRGLPALTINWGPWSDAGMAANLGDHDKQRMRDAGMFPLATQQGLDCMAKLLSNRVIEAGVFDVDWSLIAQQYPEPEKKTLLKHLIKVDNTKNRQDFVRDFIKASVDVKESMLVKNVRELLAGVLGLESVDAIDLDGNVFDYGVNSLMAMELKNGIQNLIKKKLPASLIMNNPSVQKITDFILALDFSTVASEMEKSRGADNTYEDNAYVGPVPLSVEQKNFLSWLKINPQWAITNHYFESDDMYDLEKLNLAINQVCKQHDSLRARFSNIEGQWLQRLVPFQAYQSVTDLDWRSIKDKTEMLSRLKDFSEDKSLAHKLDSDPLVRITVVRYGDEGKSIILFSLHHFALDGYSIYILTEDIQTAYRQLLKNEAVNLPRQTTTVRDWISALTDLAGSVEVMNEIPYWKSLPLSEACSTPLDMPENLDKRYIRTHARYETELGGQLSGKIMRSLPKNNNIKSFNIFLAAFAVAVSEWKGSSDVAFGAVDNGRSLIKGNDNIDLSRTIGWLSILKVIFINRPENCSLAQLVSYIGEKMTNLPNGGANLELMSAYHESASIRDDLQMLPRPRIWINYSGNPLRNDKLGVRELEGYNWINRENQLPWYFLVSINEVNNVVHIYWDYSVAVHKDKTVQRLANRFNDVLDEIVVSLEREMLAVDGAISEEKELV